MANFFYNSNGSATAPYDTWAKAATSLATVAAAMSAGDTLFVGDNSAESVAGTITATFPGTTSNPNFIYVADHLVATPTSSDLKLGAAGAGSVATTGANSITLNGCFYWYGAYITAGSGAVSASLILVNTAGNSQTFENSTLIQGGTGNGQMQCGTAGSTLTLTNSTYKSASGVAILNRGRFTWKNTNGSPAVDASGTALTNFISNTAGAVFFAEGLDLSGAALASKTLIADAATIATRFTFKDCKLATSYTGSAAQTGPGGVAEIELIHCSTGANYYLHERFTGSGTQTTQTGAARTSGASDGTTAVAWKLTTTARANFITPFVSLPVFIWNTVTASNVTVTVEGIADPRDFSALPTNAEAWIEVEYFGSSSTPVGSFKSGAKSNPLASASALTASTQAWDSGATARANSTAYSLGDIRKTATNSGRLFLCTTAGTSAGSEPGGYATAVDGDSITDGTAVFKAMWRFRQAVTLTSPQPQSAGTLTVRAMAAKASLNGIYFDPRPALS